MEFERFLMVLVELLFILLIIATSYCKAVISRVNVVCRGQDVYFNFSSPHQILYAQFGEQKKGELGPDPYLIRIDEKNRVHKVSNTSYSHRLSYNGRVQDGFLLFMLNNTQVNDSRTFRIYLKEVTMETAMYAVDYKLLVKDNCTSTVTVTLSAVGHITTTAISKPPGISTNGTTLGPGNNTKGNTTSKTTDTTTFAIVIILSFVIGFKALLFLTFSFIRWHIIKRQNDNPAGISNGIELGRQNQPANVDPSCNTTRENTTDESCETECFINEPASHLADDDIKTYANGLPGISNQP